LAKFGNSFLSSENDFEKSLELKSEVKFDSDKDGAKRKPSWEYDFFGVNLLEARK